MLLTLFWGAGSYKKYDVILAMYHDQGLIPFKMQSFGQGVNITVGLPFIRTSPDHGTAFDIAGKNEANPSSFRAALYQAIDMAKCRKEYEDIRKNRVEKTAKPSEEVVELVSKYNTQKLSKFRFYSEHSHEIGLILLIPRGFAKRCSQYTLIQRYTFFY